MHTCDNQGSKLESSMTYREDKFERQRVKESRYVEGKNTKLKVSITCLRGYIIS